MKKILFSAIILSLAVVSCKKDNVPVTRVYLNTYSAKILVGDTVHLTATVLPEDATNKGVNWSVSNPAVASFDNGIVTALSVGTANITATSKDGGKTGVFALIVGAVVNNVTLNKTSDTLYTGERLQLTATIFPEDAMVKTVTWTSSDPAVATVNNDGRVEARSAGSVIITVTTENRNQTANCTITVVPLHDEYSCNNRTVAELEKILGTAEFSHFRTHVVGNQEWSAPVIATGCSKTTYAGGGSNTGGNYAADCRVNSDRGLYGDLFSWCAVIRFQNQLCPDDWRIPTEQDFRDLDIAMGGTGGDRGGAWGDSATALFINDNYVNPGVWGGNYGGYCDRNGTLGAQGSDAYYWTSARGGSSSDGALMCVYDDSGIGGISFSLRFRGGGGGLTLRCVRNKN